MAPRLGRMQALPAKACCALSMSMWAARLRRVARGCGLAGRISPTSVAWLPRLLLQNESAARHFGALHFTGLGITGISRAQLEDWLAAVAPGARVQQRDRARARALEIFDRSFAITNALTLLALTVAVVGLYNAMVGLRLNRLATRQLLASLGVTSAEERHIELVRALGLGLFAVLLAVPWGWPWVRSSAA